MRKTYVVTLSAEEHTRLEKLVSTGRASAKRQTHGRILLKADTSPLGQVGRMSRSVLPWRSVSPR